MRRYLACILMMAGLLAAEPVCAEIVYARPAVWHVKGTRGTVTLFGSLHILPANMSWLTPDLLRALSRTNEFVFEVPTDANSQSQLNRLIATNGSLPEGQSLRAMLPPESLNAYDTAVAAAHLSPAVTDRERPWLVSLQLTLADTMNRNYYPDAGADYVLMSWANAHGRRVHYLETIDQQFSLLADDNLPIEQFEAGLKKFNSAQDSIQPLIEAWSRGDVATLGALMDANFASHSEAKKKLLSDRNHKWTSQIETMLGENRNYFVTVGAAHLAGSEGVPALLRARGYQVDGP